MNPNRFQPAADFGSFGAIRTDLEISEFPSLESPEKDGKSANSPPKKVLPNGITQDSAPARPELNITGNH